MRKVCSVVKEERRHLRVVSEYSSKGFLHNVNAGNAEKEIVPRMLAY
jgi:hypothetical protein